MTKYHTIRPGIAMGIATFETLVENSSIFADKSLFIRDFWNNRASVVLTTYPRRSGKSMNLRMVQSFFRVEVDEKGEPLPIKKRHFRKYFEGGDCVLSNNKTIKLSSLNISKDDDMMYDQGQHPVIYMDMKDCAKGSSDSVLSSMKSFLGDTFREHEYLLESEQLSQDDKDILGKYINRSSCEALTDEELHSSILFLSRLLCEHFDKKVIILIDEYDAPINKAYMKLSNDEFEQVISLFREIYGPALKNNEYLAKALITGVTRIAKANLFSGLNNLAEYNISKPRFAPYYGFTQAEVETFVEHFLYTSMIYQGK